LVYVVVLPGGESGRRRFYHLLLFHLRHPPRRRGVCSPLRPLLLHTLAPSRNVPLCNSCCVPARRSGIPWRLYVTGPSLKVYAPHQCLHPAQIPVAHAASACTVQALCISSMDVVAVISCRRRPLPVRDAMVKFSRGLPQSFKHTTTRQIASADESVTSDARALRHLQPHLDCTAT
jgi:hypothetical protein